MKLYIYEHCPFCARARMIFGLKHIPVELSVIMEGDADTPTRLVGRKVAPILVKDDGTAMAESMDIVRYVDSMEGPAVVVEPPREDIEAWLKDARPTMLNLCIPRFTRSSFKEISTEAARQAYLARETKAFGDLDRLMDDTPTFRPQMDDLLVRLDALMAEREAISPSDLVLYSTLRSLSIVKGLSFPTKVASFMGEMERATGVPPFFDRAI